MTSEPPSVDSCDGDDVRLLVRGTNRIRVQARMSCRGMVVLSESWFPGWVARVDGRDMPVHEVFGALRGVVVERGEHSIELHYRPLSVYGGAAISAFGLLLAGSVLIWDGRRGQASQPAPRQFPPT